MNQNCLPLLFQASYTKAVGRMCLSQSSSLQSSTASWVTGAGAVSPVPAAVVWPRATSCWPPWRWPVAPTGASSSGTSTTSDASSPLGTSPVSWSSGKDGERGGKTVYLLYFSFGLNQTAVDVVYFLKVVLLLQFSCFTYF